MADFFHRHDHACERPVKGVHSIKGDRGLITELATCHRCGGAGGADKWKRTGWTCYNCGGTGNKGWRDRKVYTAEKIVKLDEALLKSRERRAAKIKAKRDATIEGFKADHPTFMAALIAEVGRVDGCCYTLRDMLHKVEEHGSLTDRQIDFAESLISEARDSREAARIEAEEKARRIDASSHITGEVGDRLVIKGVVLDTFSGPGGFRGNGWTLTKIDTDDGLVVFWGSLHIAGPDDFEVYAAKGDTVELKATIKEFSERDGEKQTTVNRPKIINIELTGEE